MRRAIELVLQGHSVSVAGERGGFRSIGKFVAMFRRWMGATPARYLMALGLGESARVG